MVKLVYGVGINDAKYTVIPSISGKRKTCPFYRKWKDMLGRCYSEKVIKANPTYAGCTVTSEWLGFSNFKAWMEKQDWEGNQLDKDLLVSGNKVYGPDTCVFVSGDVNKFMTESLKIRGDLPIGVSWHKGNSKYHAQCNNLSRGSGKSLGYYDTAEIAHAVYLERKKTLAIELALLQNNPVVSEALLRRYT